MPNKLLYRKRFVPMENIALKDDQILLLTEDLIVTRWNSLKPRTDMASGISAYFIKDGIKVSKLFRPDGTFFRWYCDMIHTYFSDTSITFEDLLIDVIIETDGTTRVIDLKEAADVLKEQRISPERICEALTSLDLLLTKIYAGEFSHYSSVVEKFERQLSNS